MRMPAVTLALLAGFGCRDKAPVPSVAESGTTAATLADTAGRPMLLVFSRDYCTPCQVMKPWVEELAEGTHDVDVVTVNVDRSAYEHIGSFFKVSAVPTLVYLHGDGQVARRTEGLAKTEQMQAVLQELGWAP